MCSSVGCKRIDHEIDGFTNRRRHSHKNRRPVSFQGARRTCQILVTLLYNSTLLFSCFRFLLLLPITLNT